MFIVWYYLEKCIWKTLVWGKAKMVNQGPGDWYFPSSFDKMVSLFWISMSSFIKMRNFHYSVPKISCYFMVLRFPPVFQLKFCGHGFDLFYIFERSASPWKVISQEAFLKGQLGLGHLGRLKAINMCGSPPARPRTGKITPPLDKFP